MHILTFAIRTDGFAEPPIPSLAAKPPTGPGWVHEIKHDGCRQIASRDGAAVGLLTSQSLETDLTRVVHCTHSPIFGDWSSFRRFSLDSLILENGWLGSLNLEVTGHHQT